MAELRALAKELCNGSCKHQDCSQQLCNLHLILLYRNTYKRRWSPWLSHSTRVPSQRSIPPECRWWCSEITKENSESLHKGQCNSSANQQVQSEAALLITHSQFSSFTNSSCHVYSAVLVSMEWKLLGRVLGFRLSRVSSTQPVSAREKTSHVETKGLLRPPSTQVGRK